MIKAGVEQMCEASRISAPQPLPDIPQVKRSGASGLQQDFGVGGRRNAGGQDSIIASKFFFAPQLD